MGICNLEGERLRVMVAGRPELSCEGVIHLDLVAQLIEIDITHSKHLILDTVPGIDLAVLFGAQGLQLAQDFFQSHSEVPRNSSSSSGSSSLI